MRGVLLDLVLTIKERPVGDVKFEDGLDDSGFELVELRILHGGSRAICRIATLDFRRASCCFFKSLLGGIPRVRTLEEMGVRKSWLIFKYHFLQDQDQCVSMGKKSVKEDRRPA